jgi:hypothetical protein
MRDSRNESMGLLGQARSIVSGTEGLVTDLNDQWFRSEGMMAAVLADEARVDSAGLGAPASTHFLMATMAAACSFPEGGIFTSPAWLTAARRVPLERLPGITAGPEAPPLSKASRDSSLKSPSCLRGPWHFWQDSTRTGRISFSNKVSSPAAKATENMVDQMNKPTATRNIA